MQTYKEIVAEIRGLRWDKLNAKELRVLMTLALTAAEEFAASLRIAKAHYPNSRLLEAMAKGELNTANLSFADFKRSGDHSEFLEHFVKKHNLLAGCSPEVLTARARYLDTVMLLPLRVRTMSIVAREYELPGIFKGILQAKKWHGEALEAFKHFLEMHIRLDEGEHGHAAQLRRFKVDDRVLPFFVARRELYRCIPALWEK